MKKILSIFITGIASLLATFAQDGFHEQIQQGNANAAKVELLGLTPQMGWRTCDKFAGNLDEKVIRQMADRIVELGLADAGYIYLNIDDCWHGERDENGFIQADPVRFPSGIKALADYVHSKGLKLGIYSDAGCKTCAGRPGSLGHEYQDALTYARWGIDYLKYDWCFTDDINPKGAYILMRDALAATGRPIFFSMCEWGTSQPWLWASEVGNSWRSTGDIGVSFRENIYHDTWTQLSVLSIVDLNEPLRQYAGPGHWNDPDMLECGNGLTIEQDRSHFTLWAMMAAPLILGNDLSDMTPAVYDIITNKDVIAIDQDPLGIQGFRHKVIDGVEYWFKPLSDGKWAMTIFNRNTWDTTVALDWQEFNLKDNLSGRSTEFDTFVYNVKDVWGNAPKSLVNTCAGAEFKLTSDDVVTFILTPAGRQASFTAVPGKNNWIFGADTPVTISFTAFNPSNSATRAKYSLNLETDTHRHIKSWKKDVALNGNESRALSFNLGKLVPGFYTITLSKEGGLHKTFNIGVDPDKVISEPDCQPDFKAFWDKARAELAAVAPEYALELMPERCNQTGSVYKVTMNSLDNHRLQCFLAVPAKAGKYPVVINYNGYGSTCWIPEPNPDYCVMTVSTRGQGEIENNIYGDWIRYNIDNPEKYYYRSAFMDLVRAIDFAAQCEMIDPRNMFAQGGSQGGAFTLAAASLDHRLRAVAPDVPFLSDYPDYFKIVDWPATPVFEAQKAAGLSDEQLYKNLSYFDIKNLAQWLECPVLMAFGLQDVTCPPHTNFSGFNNIPHQNKTWKVYPQRGHDVWTESDWDGIRWNFFKQFIQ